MKRQFVIPNHPRMDANTIQSFSRELEAISNENFDPQYAELKVMKLVPMDLSSASPTDERWTRRSFDTLGEAALVKDYGPGGFPRVGETGAEESVKFVDYGVSYGYTIDELKQSAALKRPLDRDRARRARAAMDRKLDNVIGFGESSVSHKGLMNLSGTNSYTVPAGASTSKLITTKTAAECLTDLKGILHKAAQSTREIEKSRRIVMDPESYRYMSELPFNSFSSTSVLQFFLGNNPGVEILTWERLSDAGSGGIAPKWIAYDPDPLKIRCIMTIPFEMMDPQLNGMEYSIYCRSRLAGVDNPFPKSVTYADFTA